MDMLVWGLMGAGAIGLIGYGFWAYTSGRKKPRQEAAPYQPEPTEPYRQPAPKPFDPPRPAQRRRRENSELAKILRYDETYLFTAETLETWVTFKNRIISPTSRRDLIRAEQEKIADEHEILLSILRALAGEGSLRDLR